MGLAQTFGVVVVGVEAHVVRVEAHLASGLPGMSIVGLADTAVAEARDRVRAAVLTSGARWPSSRITVGLSPASLHKRGSGLDMAIAAAILSADDQVVGDRLDACLLFAELGLDGSARPVRGAVVAAVAAARAGLPRIVVAAADHAAAAVVPGVRAESVSSLRDLAALLSGAPRPDVLLTGGRSPSALPGDPPGAGGSPPGSPDAPGAPAPDLADVLGQPEAVAALRVAAAGGHHVAMVGRPGVGKTMLAERLPSLLPDLTDEDALTVTAIRSTVDEVTGLVRRPPFQAPHHTATVAALVGGGRGGHPVPGSVTLAHAGVLFLDEAAEFGSACLEALRQPLESGSVQIARAGFTARMPARFQLVMAANPCPCGLGDGTGEQCRCRSVDRRRYLARLSGPLLDRVDIRLSVGAPLPGAWSSSHTGSDSASVRQEVTGARLRAADRCRRLGLPVLPNSSLPASVLRDELAPERAAADLIAAAVGTGRLSGRGADRVVRVAWSLADLAGESRPGLAQVGHAMTLRDWIGGGLDG